MRFFSSIFTTRKEDFGSLPKALLDAAVERAVDRTDRRLRALSSYRKHLRKPVARAMRHVIRLVGQMPKAAEISPHRYGSDPRLRAAFASPDHLSDVLHRFQTVRDYLEDRPGPLPDDIFGLLIMSQRQRQVLGMELHGDTLRRDVLQTAVSFSDHRYIAPTDNERLTRRELQKRAFDFLLEKASERMGADKLRRGDLARERLQVRRKIEALKSGRGSYGGLFSGTDELGRRLNRLEAELERIDAALGRFGGIQLGLEESLGHVIDTLNQSEELLVLQTLSVNIDYRGIKGAASAPSSAPPVEVIEVSSSTGLRRIVLLGRIPRNHLPTRRDVIKLGEAYLGTPRGHRASN